MKTQSFPTYEKPSLSRVFIVNTISPALVMTPIEDAISKMLCQVPVRTFKWRGGRKMEGKKIILV